ncbi:DHS-like NAD/FAD-binding domain-containing protein [Mycena rosella]|uniref:DHS-like NAD/FAD-binding domain-containing protein n=1 Tax=Mycena rosella TaxID=1033263 RepID=A0AAD7G9C0_MYCRO|nr:DHS-like NAD/FAD-binding domain-containing protein [Mycena rosella]
MSSSPLLPLPATSSPIQEAVHLRASPSSQIRAFLAASEDVDIDPETVEELLQALIIETTSSNADESPGIPHASEDSDGAESGSGFDLEVSELDMSALYFVSDEDVQPWSQQQIRGMMHHLKEYGMSSWMNEYVLKRSIPIPQLLLAFGINLSPSLHNMSPATLTYFLRVAMSRELQLRDKLPNYNTVEDAVRLISTSRRILILTGAGISVSCGIPDFRSRDGLYASLKERGDYDLDDPQQMFDINYFRENPTGSNSQIYPSNFIPSPCHRFIKLVEDKNQLLRNYTQNVDGLQGVAGVGPGSIMECHGSFTTASCLLCRRQVPGSEIKADIFAQKVPLCSVCNAPQPGASPRKPKSKKRKSAKKAKGAWDSDDEDESDDPSFPPGIMKPDITFFGEKLADKFGDLLARDRNEVDLLLVIGTSLKVSPVADILCHLPHSVPQILINKTPVRHINPDIILLGNADDIIIHLCAKLGWELPPPTPNSRAASPGFLGHKSKKRSAADLDILQEPQRVGESHIWLFEGAEGGDWLQNIEQRIVSGLDAELAGGPDAELEQSPKKQRLE